MSGGLNLDYEVSEEELNRFFGQMGQVKRISMPKDFVTGKSRGFAFVTMGDREVAARVVTDVQGQMIFGRPLRLGWARY
jgi:RNA recognition motif-containing protein